MPLPPTPPATRTPGPLRSIALTVLTAGAVASVSLTLWMGRRNPSRLLMLLFVGWVVAPFAGLLFAEMRSTRWPARVGATLYAVMVIVSLGSVALYADIALRSQSKPASRFLLVPLGTWVLMAVALAIASWRAGSRTSR